MDMLTKFNDVENKIIDLRGQKVILDTDTAVLYGVSTKEINQAVRNNPEKFPEGYILALTKAEKTEVVKNFDHLERLKYSAQLPKAFTEKGLYMLATILKGEKATTTTIAIIETYANLKNLTRNLKLTLDQSEDLSKRMILEKSGRLLTEILSEELKTQEEEVTIEIDLAVLKYKHTIKRK
jgi:hypothetical protein